jgi:hypothetical protein
MIANHRSGFETNSASTGFIRRLAEAREGERGMAKGRRFATPMKKHVGRGFTATKYL